MNKLISLALHVGRLEARLEALEKRLEWEPPAPEVHVELGHAATGADPKAEEDARQAERLLQEGIDNIMGPGGRVSDGKEGNHPRVRVERVRDGLQLQGRAQSV